MKEESKRNVDYKRGKYMLKRGNQNEKEACGIKKNNILLEERATLFSEGFRRKKINN